MPTIQAFRGLRYDLGHVGSLSDVVTPPYDVISPELQEALYQRHPANFIRLELNRPEPGDDEHSNRYTRAARFLKQWRQEGVLRLDPDPALYVYHQTFTHQGQTLTRRGFMARLRLQRFGEGRIYPHEETLSGPKEDRLRLMQACRANLSQIFGLYPDPDNAAQERLEAAIAGQTPLEATDPWGVVHRLWVVSDVKLIADVAALLAPRPLFIADGHHRYETALKYRDLLAQQGPLDEQHPAQFVLAQCVSMNDPGLVILPTHRLFRGVRPISSDLLQSRLGAFFHTRTVARGADLAPSIWEDLQIAGDQERIAFYTAQDDTWTHAHLTPEGRAKMAELASEHSPAWRGLGVAILHRLVVEHLLRGADWPKPLFVHSAEEVAQYLRKGDSVGRDATGQVATGGRFELAALVMPATVDHVQTISQQGERMPAKSTYFFPKLLAGLVVHLLE
jgi:uncharacterized protein (DUF1015 family)